MKELTPEQITMLIRDHDTAVTEYMKALNRGRGTLGRHKSVEKSVKRLWHVMAGRAPTDRELEGSQEL